MLRKALSAVSLFAFILLTCSWGFLVHRTSTQVAIYELPKNIQPFFYKEMGYLVKNCTRPDERRNSDQTEAPKHFIDIDAYGTNAINEMPLTWDEAVKKYTKDTLFKYGYVPYHVVAMKNKLTDAFKAGNKDSILFYAADISHYIEDANVPLHTTTNYDGQLTNQNGLHSLWESMIPELEISSYDLASKHTATYLESPEKAIWEAVRRSNSLVKDVLEKEREVTASFTDSTKYRVQIRRGKESKSYTTAFAKAYSAALKPTINGQLLNAANLVADFWYTAWVDAGKPDVSKLVSLSNEDNVELEKQMKSFKANQLLQDKLLIAKKDAQGE